MGVARGGGGGGGGEGGGDFCSLCVGESSSDHRSSLLGGVLGVRSQWRPICTFGRRSP